MGSLRSWPGYLSLFRPARSIPTLAGSSSTPSRCHSPPSLPWRCRLLSTTSLRPSPAPPKKKAASPAGRKAGSSTKQKKPGMNAVNKPVRASAKAKAGRSESYAQIRILKQNMFSPAPPPLRMGRQRHLRHWTIHRAWLLFRRKQREELRQEKERMHQGMFNACEELRKTRGPLGRDEGYLYRVALEKKGVWHTDAVPIEYARGQTDSPAQEAWDHGWKR